eukprot:SAG11_NODE_220_length_12154_cov_92.233347_8_plen_193_part_00
MLISPLTIPTNPALLEVNLSMNKCFEVEVNDANILARALFDKYTASDALLTIEALQTMLKPKHGEIPLENLRPQWVQASEQCGADAEKGMNADQFVSVHTSMVEELWSGPEPVERTGLEAFIEAMKQTRVRHSDISKCGLTSMGLTKLATLLTSETSFTAALTEVVLSGNRSLVEADIELLKQTSSRVTITI